MTIVVKIGSQALLENKGVLDRGLIASLMWQIAVLKKQGHVVYLISSGAVAAGRGAWPGQKKLDETALRQILAGIGQIELMQVYKEAAVQHGLNVVQILLSKGDFISRNHYLNLERLLLNTQQFPELLPIINENDSISVEELMFTDNDQLAGVLARQLDADVLLLLSEVAGVYDRDPSNNSGARLLDILGRGPWPKLQGKSQGGRGGIASKLETAKKMSRAGVTSIIAAAREPEILLRCLEELGEGGLVGKLSNEGLLSEALEKWPVGTLVLPKPCVGSGNKSGNMRKWLSARHLADSRGRIIVNDGLAKKLEGEKQVLSILPIGIQASRGQFSQGDLVDIYAPTGKKLGVGQARYSSEQLEKSIAKKNQRVFIHYNYLYVENWN